MTQDAQTLWARAAAIALLALAACNGQTDGTTRIRAESPSGGPAGDDRSMCPMRTRQDVEVAETSSRGSPHANVRRVWRVYGEGSDSRKVLVCREVDSDFDGIKDEVVYYNEEGQKKEERADADHNGRFDTWTIYANGRRAEVRLDRNSDGKPDQWKSYVEGKLNRIKRDSNFDGRPDVWEMYRKGHLERMGVDLNGDERVDRWDHDEDWRRAIERTEDKQRREKEQKEREESERRAREAGEAATAEDSE
jgi:hypothetical protein